MPTYEYKCLKCKKTFEKTQRMSDAALKKCEFCKGSVQRLIGMGGGLIFKGSGFYETDYKRPRTEDRGRKTEGGGRLPAGQAGKAEDVKQKTEGAGQKTEKKEQSAKDKESPGKKKE